MKDPIDKSRRNFIRTVGVLGLGSTLSIADGFAQDSPLPEKKQTDKTAVPTRPFGKTGVNVSCLGLGGMFDIPSNQLVLKAAQRYGVTYWDTADCYEGGNSELGIGQFFKKYPESRKDVFLVTKSDARDPEGISKLLARSLERMNTDWIDLYLIHGIRSIKELNEDTKAWADKAKAAGKIKFFGFSTHSNMEECLLAASKLGWIDGIMMTYNFRLMNTDRMKRAVEACAQAGIGLTAMKTQGGGSVSTENEIELELAGRFIKQGFTDMQAKLKAVWENPHIASICSQMPTLAILTANIAAALNQTKLSSSDRESLKRYARETASSYCAGCADVCESCFDKPLPVRDLMRCLMYYHSYGEKERARTLFAKISADIHWEFMDADCSVAESRCPQRLPIGALLREAKTLLS